MAKKKSGGGTPATVTLDRAGVDYQVRTYEHDPSVENYGMEAAHELGVDPSRVFKTLLVDSGDRALAVGVVPVDCQLDLKALAAALGVKKVTMADPALAERVTGYVVGGISPIGQKKRLPMVLDDSAVHCSTVLVSGGRRGFDIEVAPSDLLAVTGANTAPIARRN